MSSPTGVVDLSLPDYATLVARAGVDPDAEAARVAGASPDAVTRAGTAFARAGGELDGAYTRSTGAASTLGRAFVNDGAAVYDRGTHLSNLPAGFGEAGSRLTGASSRLGAVADDLSGAMRETSSAVSGLHAELSQMRSQWAARVAAAGTGPGGLIPEAAVPGLLAERDRVAAAMTGRVGQVGRTVSTRIRAYEVVVNDALRILADQGFVPAADLDRPAPAVPRLEGGVDPTGLGTPLMAGYAADPVNTALGNFVEVETDLPFSGLLAGLAVERTYNSRSDGDGPFGARWASWATTRLELGTWTAEFEGPDGQRVSVPRTGPAAFGRVPGLGALVEPLPGPDGGAVLAWFDGRRWEFDGSGRIARTWSGPGTAVAFAYDDGRLVELTHERGRRVRLEWAGGRIVAAHTPGCSVEYGYAAGRLVVADGPGGQRRYDHDEAGRVTSVTDADGVVELVNTYDPDGRVLTQRSPFGRLVTFDYAVDGSTVVADDAAGPRNVYRHDAAGRLVAVTDGHGHTQHRRFDRWGDPVEIVERGGAVTRQEFDQRSRLTRRTWPSGTVEVFTWDADDRVVRVDVTGPDVPAAATRLRYDGRERTPSEIVDSEGGVTRLVVAGGLVTAVTDADGVTVRYRHDADGQLVEAVDGRGGVTRIERDPAGRPTAVTTPAGRRTGLVHDPAGRLVECRDPTGGARRLEYTAAGRLRAVVDAAGRRELRHGVHGEVTELVDPLGAVTSRQFDQLGNLVAVTTAEGVKSTYRHDALSRPAAWSGPAGGTWVAEYDADGNPTAIVDPTGVRVDLRHDAAGRLVRVDDGLVVTAYRHDGLGRSVAELRADGTAREIAHDRCGRPVAITGPDGSVIRLGYTPAGRLARIVTPTGRTQERVHDETGRLVTVVDGGGQAWQLRYDPDGLLSERISPAGLTESITRDEAGRVVRHHVPGRGSTAYGYDDAGRVVEVTDRHGRRRLRRDPAGRVVAVTDALDHATGYTYDGDGRLVAVTDPLGQVTRYTHADGRVAAVTDPLGRVTRYRHDPAGRLCEQIDPDGARRVIDHDASGRPCRLTATRGPDEVTITVDRDVLARPVRIAEKGGHPIELRWDRADRLVERRRAGRVVGWSYDADGLRVAVHNPDGTSTNERRDGAGRVVGVEHPLIGRIELHRDPDGRLLGVRDARVAARFGWAGGWLTSHDVTTRAGRHSTRLSRDGDGRVVAADLDGRPARYGYDAAGQLCHAVDATGEYRFTYDPAGRLTTEIRASGPRHRRHDRAGQLETISTPDGEHRLAHDACGRRVVDDAPGRARRYTWDPLGRLASVTTAGRRITPDVDAQGELAGVDDVALGWDTADPLAPLLSLGDTTVVGYGHPWAQAGEWGAAPFVPDWQHTPEGRQGDPWGGCDRSGHDATGRERSGHDAPDRGAPAAPAVGYRGELTVDGLIWLRHRAYDPATRAFLTPDPLPPVPGTAYAANPYHYAGNDPVNALDPLGLRPLTDADLAVQRAAGGPLAAVLAGGAGPLGDPYRGLSPVNGVLTAADVAGGLYGAKLEVDAHYGTLAGRYEQGFARDNLARVRQGPVVSPAQFYDDLDHYTAVGRHGDDLVAQAARTERASKLVPPKIGGGLALAGIGYDIATGKDPVQAVAAGAGGFAASVGAGALVGQVLIPIPGVGAAAGALVGAAAGTFTSGFIDSMFENGPDVGAALARGGEAVTDTAGAVVGGVGKAVHGIAGLFG